MSTDRTNDVSFGRSIRRVLIGVTLVLLMAVFLFWRIDNPRVERVRLSIIDRVMPSFDWALVPVSNLARMLGDFQSYTNIYEQNQELRRELQRMKSWKEAALQLEQTNARLRELNTVRLDPKLTFVTGVVLTDSGSPFSRSALINLGQRDGIMDGWAVMDGFGLAGRISGVASNTSRVVLLTDTDSRVPVTVQPSGQQAIMVGLNSTNPLLEFLESPDDIRPGDRVTSSGDGGVFPPGLLAGQVKQAPDGRLFVVLAADYKRLEFLRVLRSAPSETVTESETLIGTLSPEQTAIQPSVDEADNAVGQGDE